MAARTGARATSAAAADGALRSQPGCMVQPPVDSNGFPGHSQHAVEAGSKVPEGALTALGLPQPAASSLTQPEAVGHGDSSAAISNQCTAAGGVLCELVSGSASKPCGAAINAAGVSDSKSKPPTLAQLNAQLAALLKHKGAKQSRMQRYCAGMVA